ncbi:MAG: glycosyltransferase family 9 protein [Candidatus Magnetoovum sp. WYHC-5]|nr:glycosyltransferase family 9 protein [Candidatus Magnetoovum sp. WYHC-5]
MNLTNINKILSIHHMLAMGEVVLLSAAFNVIKENLPDSSITVIAGKYASQFLKSVPNVDRVLPIERFGIFLTKVSRLKRLLYKPLISPLIASFVKRNAFDCVFIRNDERLPYTTQIRHGVKNGLSGELIFLKPLLEKYMSSQRHVVEGYFDILRGLGFTINNTTTPKLLISAEATKKAKEFIKGQKIVGICPTSNLKIKGWDAKNTAKLCDTLSQNYAVLIFSTDKTYVQLVSSFTKSKPTIIGYMDFDVLVALIAECSLFISVDTGPMHVAAAVGVPTVGLFGPTSGVMFGPLGANSTVIQKNKICSYYNPDNFFSSFQPCYLQDNCLLRGTTCVDLITVDDVLEKITLLS